MKAIVTMEGTMPILMHNERLADPLDDYVRRIKVITDKRRNMTEEDHLMKSRLEWEGGLYYNSSLGPFIPGANIVRCLVAAGTIRRLGTHVSRSTALIDPEVRLEFDGPRDVDGMWKAGMFDRRMVGVGQNRVQRTRPAFQPWSLKTEFLFFAEIMSEDDFKWCLDMAGKAIGLCDGRRIGFGRFTAKVDFSE